MPSRPRSSVALPAICPATLMNRRFADTLGWLSNTCTVPVFSTTYQRALLAGSCSISTGEENAARLGNTRSTARDTTPEGASPARQLELAGRESRPDNAPGAMGGVVPTPPPPASPESPPQACSIPSRQAAAKRILCPGRSMCPAHHSAAPGSRCALRATRQEKPGPTGPDRARGSEAHVDAHYIS